MVLGERVCCRESGPDTALSPAHEAKTTDLPKQPSK
jgi:hypothetical protein